MSARRDRLERLLDQWQAEAGDDVRIIASRRYLVEGLRRHPDLMERLSMILAAENDDG